MTKIKICGLQREEDILYVNKLKPDYVGFVFAESKRQVDKVRARELIEKLDKDIKTVGIFSNSSIDKVKHIALYCNLDVLQFHGDELPSYCSFFNQCIWKAFRIKDENSLRKLDAYNVQGFLLDTFTKGIYGGTGKAFNWDLVCKMYKEKFIILAGGLTPENIKKAIKTVSPSVVDVSSGVETYGAKDFEKMKNFIEKVRE